MHYDYRNINSAFSGLIQGIATKTISTKENSSRNGPVLSIPEPVIITFQKPKERVLFNKVRDCNPFFHVYESLWMLAGRNDLESLTNYLPSFENYSDDGETLHGAYGHRWRKWFDFDQLDYIANMLFHSPDSRRCVLQMWDGKDLIKAGQNGKDVPCNLSALFSINTVNNKSSLNMTVYNRSNDLIWGMLGANAVHFSFLQEYLAKACGNLNVGKYHQVSNNLHVYVDNWKGLTYVEEENMTQHSINYKSLAQEDLVPLVSNVKTFDKEVVEFINNPEGVFSEPFLATVAAPMALAYRHHKERNYTLALEAADRIQSGDWKEVSKVWLTKRKNNWVIKNRGTQAI